MCDIIFVFAVGIISLTARQGNDSDLTYNQKGAGTFLSHLVDVHITASKVNLQKDDSIAQRQTARSQTISILKQYPSVLIAGVGAGQYIYFAGHHGAANIYGSPNNLDLEQLEQTGIVGLGLLLCFAAGLIFGLYKKSRKFAGIEKIVTTVLVAYFIAIGFQAQTFAGLVLTHLWFAIGLGLFLVQLPYTKHKE